jgi:hypothetical protein
MEGVNGGVVEGVVQAGTGGSLGASNEGGTRRTGGCSTSRQNAVGKGIKVLTDKTALGGWKMSLLVFARKLFPRAWVVIEGFVGGVAERCERGAAGRVAKQAFRSRFRA